MVCVSTLAVDVPGTWPTLVWAPEAASLTLYSVLLLYLLQNIIPNNTFMICFSY